MKYRFEHPTERVLIFLLVALVGLVAAILWVFGQRLNNHEFNIDQTSFDANNFALKIYERSAAQDLYLNNAVVEPKDKQVYLPELSIYLPFSQLSRNLMYTYSSADTASKRPEEIKLTTRGNLNRYINSFAEIACQQKLVAVSVGSSDPELQSEYGQADGSLTLKDGRTFYFYESSKKGCVTFWDSTPQKVVELLKQAQSY